MNPKFMKRAIELAQTHMSNHEGGPFGAVIVRNGKIVAEGWNQVTSSFDPTAHAEVVAIRRASAKEKNFDLAGCELYTSCEPCPMCLSAAYWARISKIYYGATREDAARHGFDDDYIYREVPKKIAERSLPMAQLQADEACKVFIAWDKLVDKVKY